MTHQWVLIIKVCDSQYALDTNLLHRQPLTVYVSYQSMVGRQHNYNLCIVVPDHSPEVFCCVGKRMLGNDEFITLVVTLKKKRKTTTSPDTGQHERLAKHLLSFHCFTHDFSQKCCSVGFIWSFVFSRSPSWTRGKLRVISAELSTWKLNDKLCCRLGDGGEHIHKAPRCIHSSFCPFLCGQIVLPWLSELSIHVLISEWFSVYSQSAYCTWRCVITSHWVCILFFQFECLLGRPCLIKTRFMCTIMQNILEDFNKSWFYIII